MRIPAQGVHYYDVEQETFLRALEQLLEVPFASLEQDTEITSIESWDSLRVVELVGLLDSDYGITVDYEALADCKTVGDLIALKEQACAANPAIPAALV